MTVSHFRPTLTEVVELGREQVRAWLPALDQWLLPGHSYSVHHTWPLLYRSDGRGRFYATFDGERLVSHCATREVTLLGAEGPRQVALLGSVATDPDYRGQGLAGRLLDRAVEVATRSCDHVLLWAERPDLYRRHGFCDGRAEACLVLARLPATTVDGPPEHGHTIRLAEVQDHEALHRLHQHKPWRVDRTAAEMSGLLTTPGLTTLVLERGAEIAAYACCGKGADLADHWHEVGGDDQDVAALLLAALHFVGQIEAILLLPPYREGLAQALGRSAVERFGVAGPMTLSPRRALPAFWIDGLDSV